MKHKLIGPLWLLCCLSLPAPAQTITRPLNFCLNPSEQQEFADLLAKHPKDKGIIRLIAIRQGLCDMIGKHQIPLYVGLEMWAVERQKMLMERTKKHLNRITPKGP